MAKHTQPGIEPGCSLQAAFVGFPKSLRIMSAIAPMPAWDWSVVIVFDTGEKAKEFHRLITKVKEKGSTPLYNALLVTQLEKSKDIKLGKYNPQEL